ncbi:UDP-N-acetylmuramate dehydrogenase [Candidatus Deianiraea vastatrix]|nr:UDP-N-acetylmuramate dehydrogenase [Candidatus Deianiraea vastatrix]
MTDFKAKLEQITKVKYGADIGKTSWIGCGGVAEILISPQSVDELSQSLKLATQYGVLINVIGARSNTIVRDGILRGLTIWLKKGFTDMENLGDGLVRVGCGALDLTFANFCAENGISGCEFLIGIPGTIGGNIRMNAGCYGGEIKDILQSVDYVDFDGNIGTFTNADMGFSYRKTAIGHNFIFTSAVFKGKIAKSDEIFVKMDEISQKRKKTQPIGRKTVGSTFKNPRFFTKSSFEKICEEFGQNFDCTRENDDFYCDKIHSWMLIDKAGLRGLSHGGAKISDIHCNFLVNEGGATASDFENLGNLVIAKIFDKFGVKLEWEVERIGGDV